MKYTILALSLGGALSTSALAKIEIQNPWIHPNTTGSNTSLFMKIINTSDKPDQLVDVKDNASLLIDFHRNTEENGKMHTTSITSIGVPPKGNIQLAPGKNHVVLENINRPLKVGDVVKVKLEFQSGQKIDLLVPVKESADGSIQPEGNNLMMQNK